MSETTATNAPEGKKYTGPQITYALAEGQITRTDETGTITVAKYDGETVELVTEHAKFRPALIRWMNENSHPVKSVVLEGEKPAKPAMAIPPMPKKSMRLGDKTPEVVEWYRKYKPEEYRARYGVKGPGKVTKTRRTTDGDGNPVTEAYEVDATLSERKTHLTEKLEAGNASTGEYKDE